MDRNRDARSASIASSNGFNRRRSRTNGLRDSPDEDGGLELQESVRLRDRVKKDRDQDRERERGRERERSSRSRRRRGDGSSDESFHFGEEDDDEENAGGGVISSTPAVISGHISSHLHNHSCSFSQQQHNSNSTSNTVSSNHLLQRRILPGALRFSKAPPVWKSGDEMISAAVPRKARSASTKRSHDWMSTSSNNVGGVEQNLKQPWSSPARETPTPPPHPPTSPTSSNASIRKKLKLTANNSGHKLKPPKAAAVAKPSSNSSNPEEFEIEIAEVLYGLKTHSQAPSKKEESREINRLSSDAKSRNSSPISNSSSANAPLSAVAPKRKKPRQTPEKSYGERSCSIPAKTEADQAPTTEKILGSEAENGLIIAGNSVDPQAPAQIDPPHAPTPLESAKMRSELKPAGEETRESTDSVAKEEVSSPKERKSPALKAAIIPKSDSPPAVAGSSAESEKRKEEKLEIDLMAPPPQVRTDLIDSAVDKKTVVSTDNLKHEDENEEKKVKAAGEVVESNKAIEKEERNVELHIDLEKSERDGGDGVNVAGNGNKPQSLTQKQQQLLTEKSGHSASSLPLPMPMGSWPGGLPPMGYMQGVVSMEEGGAVAPGHIPTVFSQPRPKRCATHCHIARNIHYLQQLMKVNPFWHAPASLFGSKPCNLNVVPGLDYASVRVANNTQDKSQTVANIPNHVSKEKASQPASTPDFAQRNLQILIQQALPPIAPSNMLGPAFIFPLNQQQPAASRPNGVKSPANATVSSTTSGSAVTSSSPAAAVSFNYPNKASNETQYLAIVQNNGYSFPIPAAAVGAPPNYRGNPAQAMPLFNGPFYPSQMIHPSQLQHAQPPSIQPQLLQPHQNASASSGSSASQKHLQSQQNLSSHKTQPSQQKSQPSQQSHSQYVQQSRPRHHEGDPGREDSPSTTDSRGSRASMNIYGQSFTTIHPQNFSLMTHPAALASSGAATSASSNHADKKGHQPQQQGSSKTEPDSLSAHSFAMTFGTMNGAANIKMMASAAQIKNGRVSDDGKSGGVDSSATEDERKSSSSTGKALGGGAQSIAFTRPDLTVGSRSMTTSAVGAMNAQNAHNIQAQIQQQMQQQLMKQHQQQQQHIITAAKMAENGNGGMYSEQLNSSMSKFPNALSGLPQNLVQSNCSSPSQSPQWKSSGRTASSTPQTVSTTIKNLPQQHSRAMHTQISFGGNQKPSAAHPINNQTTSSVGSPTISSVSKGTSGSPRTTSSASTNNKTGQASSLPAQATKNSPSILGSVQKSQSQQQMPKAMQQQLFFSNLYAQSQSSKSSTTPGASGYYMARKQTEQPQQSPGVLVTLGGANTNDPATAIAAATANVKGGGIIHASQFSAQPVLPTGFSYAHPVPAAVQVKPSEQKQPAG